MIPFFAQITVNPVTNGIPLIPTPTDWIYAYSPGVYFWSGVWCMFAWGFFCLGARFVKRGIGGGHCD